MADANISSSEDELAVCDMEEVEDEFFNDRDTELMDQDRGNNGENDEAAVVISDDNEGDEDGADGADGAEVSIVDGDNSVATPGDVVSAKPRVKSTV